MPASKVSSIKYFVSGLILILLLPTAINLAPVFAQKTSLEKAKEDYAFQFGKYRDSYQSYSEAKTTYQTYQTAAAKNEAFIKTKEYLTQVDNLYIAYLLLVKESASKINWTSNPSASENTTKLADSEITYLANHQKDVQNAQNLEELPLIAKQLSDRLSQTTNGKVYKILAIYQTVNANSLYGEFSRLASSLDDLLASENSSVIANWRSEVESIKKEVSGDLDDIQKLLGQTRQDSADPDQLKNIDSEVAHVNQVLEKTKSLFAEILRLL